MKGPMTMSSAQAHAFPVLPFEDWEASKNTLHRFMQIGGKIRMRQSPKLNHWWHVTWYVTPRGLTTGPIPHGFRTFDLTFDFCAHQLVITTSTGERSTIPLRDGLSVADFYSALLRSLDETGFPVSILDRPFDLQPATPFSRDHEHASYDPDFVNRYWRVLVQADRILQQFRGGFAGKSTPVQLFWHSFDLALTRFSGKRVELPEGTDPVTQDAYSHEVISFGFWPGDFKVPEPHFYSYTAPQPDGLTDQPLEPAEAHWTSSGSGSLALLPYDVVRNATDPDGALLRFLESAYQAGARTAGWDIENLTR
jgi:hypothetical protein